MIQDQTIDGYVREYVRLINEISSLTRECAAALGQEDYDRVVQAVEEHANSLTNELPTEVGRN